MPRRESELAWHRGYLYLIITFFNRVNAALSNSGFLLIEESEDIHLFCRVHNCQAAIPGLEGNKCM